MSEEEVQDDNAFFKALPSDVDDAVSLKLLTDVYETNDMWAEFQEEDIAQVVEVFSVLNMAPGDKLITKGEYATFCGVILQGTFNAIVTPTFTVPLRAGDVIGEMALFEGGARNADIITGTDPEGCILAVITFVDLDNLAMNERYSQLARKLTMMFATASIKKLRGMLKPAAPATAAPADGAAATPAAGTTAADGAAAPATATPAATTAAATPTSPTAAPAATPATAPPPAKKERVKKEEKKPVVAETLYKNKMNKNASVGATNPDGTPLQPKNINEAQKVLEEHQQKLKKVEHAKRNQQVMLDKMQKQLKSSEEQIQLRDDNISKLNSDLKSTQDSLKESDKKNKELSKNVAELSTNLEKELKARSDMESKLTSSHADLTTKSAEEVDKLRSELESIQKKTADLEIELAGEKAALSDLKQSKELELNKAALNHTEISGAAERLTKDLSATRSRAETLELDLRNQMKHNDEQRLSLSGANMRILDLEEKLSAAMSWKLKALEFQSGLDAEKKRHIRLSDDWSKLQKELETELKHYKLLLKTFAITIYAKEFRLRKLIGHLHKRVSEMLLTTLEEHYNTSTGKEKALAKVGSNTGSMIASGVASSSAGLAASATTTFKSVRKRKKAYLDNLLKPTSKLRDVVTSLDDEVSKLKGPFEEIRERCLHWRATSESFFQRNIDLASKLMTLDKNLSESNAAKETLSVTVKEKSKDLERLTQKHADLSARYISNGASSSNDPSSGSVSGREANQVAAKLNATRADVELLEARSTVLRVHIQQLEAHYLALQGAIHSFGASAQGSAIAAGLMGQAAVGGFQEQKDNHHHHGGIQLMGPTFGGTDATRYDPALVSPIPFPTYTASGATVPHPPTAGAGSGPIVPIHSPRGAIVLAPNTRNSGAANQQQPGVGGVVYHPPANGYNPAVRQVAPGGFVFNSSHPHASLPNGPNSPKPDVISLRTLREQQQLAYMQQQQKLPPVAGAASAGGPPAGPTAIVFPMQPTPPVGAAANQQNRTQLTFTPRTN